MEFFEGVWGIGTLIQAWNTMVSIFGRPLTILLFIILPTIIPVALIAYVVIF